MTEGDRVKVVKILDADRAAGNSVCKKPPARLLGKIGTVRRRLTSWDAAWVSFGRAQKCKNLGNAMLDYPERYVFAAEELKVLEKA